MWPFWLLFLLPTLGLLGTRRLNERSQLIAWAGVGLVFTLLIGLRHEVGGDWYSYLLHLQMVAPMTFVEALEFNDPGYYGINWLVAKAGGDIYWVNLICGAIVMAGVIVFARRQPLPWLALLVAVPYLIVVVAMGYTRQSVALGLVLIGLAALGQQSVARFVFWVLLGALFHKSAVLLLPIAALASTQRKLWTWIWVAITSVVGAALFVLDASETLWTNYVEAGYSSEGGLIRVAMNAVPATLLLLLHRRLQLSPGESKLWRWMAVFALACIPLVMISSTAVDRVALYFIPIQMFLFARLHLIGADTRQRSVIVLGVIGYYAAVQWVWLNMASHAFAWLPYQFAPFL